ncbi:glycerol-3-phosphate 1-O-acyltransferase PlsY [Thermodesulfobacteriota bacterium]
MSLTMKSVFILLAYLAGSIPMGVILSHYFTGKDIRKTGSGNIGATNVYRTHGRKLGIITLIADALKGALPTLIAMLMGLSAVFVCSVGVACFLGHLYPVFLQFKGGKGVATALGIFAVISPVALLLSMLIFVLLVYKFRYVSLASLSAAASMPLLIGLLNSPEDKAYIILALIISALVFYKHKENIIRKRALLVMLLMFIELNPAVLVVTD